MIAHSFKIAVRGKCTPTLARALAAAVTLASLTRGRAGAAASWSTIADSPTCHIGPGAAVGTDNTGTRRIYLIGAEAGHVVEAYDPQGDSWTTMTPLPGSSSRLGYAVAAGGDGRIYVMGGYSGGYLSTVNAYDPKTDAWTTVASMQVARLEPAAAAGPDGRIYVFGGSGSGGVVHNSVEVYDPQTDSWSFVAPIPGDPFYLRPCAALVRCSNTIYLVGPAFGRVLAYSTRTNAWSARNDASVNIAPDFAMVTGRDGRLYAMGGNRDPHGPTSDVFVYEPLTDAWTPGPSMTVARAGEAAASLGDHIYALAGGDPCESMESYGPLLATPCPCLTAPSGMVAWWPLDEVYGTSTDESVGGALSSLVGGVGHVPGIVGGAIRLGSAGQYASVSNVAAQNFGTSSFSIDAWIRTLDDETSVRTIVDKRTGPTSTPTGYSLAISFGRLVCQLADGTGFTNFAQTASGNLTDGTWHHVAVTVDRVASVGKLFDNGAVVHTFTPSTEPGSVTNAGALRLGQAYDNSSIGFDGDIDEVELFDRALTATEVGNLWRAGGFGKCKMTGGVLGPSDPLPILKKPGFLVADRAPVGTSPVAPVPAIIANGTELSLRHSLETSGRLRIYDVAGRTIRTLELAAGTSKIRWDGHDGRGARVSAGIYLAKLTPGSAAPVQVIVLP